MSTDIVYRLCVVDLKYTEAWSQKLMEEAADEIVRLRARNEALNETIDCVRRAVGP